MVKSEVPELEGPIFCLSLKCSHTPINLLLQLAQLLPQLCGTLLNYVDLRHC